MSSPLLLAILGAAVFFLLRPGSASVPPPEITVIMPRTQRASGCGTLAMMIILIALLVGMLAR